jgi:rfaE bifunctional protein kinase chain/domain
MKDFKSYNILIIGDIMLDKYIYGNIEKISPEAPVPIFQMMHNEEKPGGAANVALNIKSLGSNPVLLSIVGDDRDGNKLLMLLEESGVETFNILRDIKKMTTVKTRLMANGQHVLRIDEENPISVDKEAERIISEQFLKIVEERDINAIILQDYDKGLLGKEMIEFFVNKARENNIFIAVDPKFNNFYDFKNVDLFKPNLKEIETALNQRIKTGKDELVQAAVELHNILKFKNLFITLGDKGIFYSDGENHDIFPTEHIDVVDVSGAGDVVLSVATIAYLENMNIEDIAVVSNKAGGLACEIMGVATISMAQLKKKL